MQYCYQPPVRFCRMSYDMGAEIFEQPLMGIKKIMVVDSSSSIRQMVDFTLKAAGYNVIQAVDGVDAIAQTKLPVNSGKNIINMFFVAQTMPRMDGLTFVRQVRAMPAYRTTPIIVLTTSQPTDSVKKTFMAAGANGFIVKPFLPNVLVTVAQKLIG